MERSCRGDANNHSHFKALFLLLEQEREVVQLPQSPSPAPSPWCVVGCSQLIPNSTTGEHPPGSHVPSPSCPSARPNKHVSKLGIQPSHLSVSSCDCHTFCLSLQRTLCKQAWERTQQWFLYIYICNIHLIITSTLLNSLNLKRGREEGISGCCGGLITFIYLSICLKYQLKVEICHRLCQELNCFVFDMHTYIQGFPALDFGGL